MLNYVEVYDGREAVFYVDLYVELPLYAESYLYVLVYGLIEVVFCVDVFVRCNNFGHMRTKLKEIAVIYHAFNYKYSYELDVVISGFSREVESSCT